MQKSIKILGLVATVVSCFLGYIYAVVFLHTPAYAGGWPVFLYYALLFPVACFAPIKIGVNLRFLRILSLTLALNFVFLYGLGADIETARTELFVGGVPTFPGFFGQMTICAAALILASGFTAVIHDYNTSFFRNPLVRAESDKEERPQSEE